MKYHLVFSHPVLGRLDGLPYDGDKNHSDLRRICRNAAQADTIVQQFRCVDGREFWLSAAQLAEGLLWIEPVEEGESSEGERPTPPKQFREEAVETAV